MSKVILEKTGNDHYFIRIKGTEQSMILHKDEMVELQKVLNIYLGK